MNPSIYITLIIVAGTVASAFGAAVHAYYNYKAKREEFVLKAIIEMHKNAAANNMLGDPSLPKELTRRQLVHFVSLYATFLQAIKNPKSPLVIPEIQPRDISEYPTNSLHAQINNQSRDMTL
jgi:hypothetical protein